ncbi:MAG: hypothetical protein ACMG6E_04290 [Candidatus Roizmanbacteria bacterium]
MFELVEVEGIRGRLEPIKYINADKDALPFGGVSQLEDLALRVQEVIRLVFGSSFGLLEGKHLDLDVVVIEG